PFSGNYTLEQATGIIEDAIAKGQVKKEFYAILPVPEKIVTPTVAQNVELTEEEVARVNAIQTEQNVDRVAAIKQLRKEQRAAAKPPKAPKEPKAPKVKKYSNEQMISVYNETKQL